VKDGVFALVALCGQKQRRLLLDAADSYQSGDDEPVVIFCIISPRNKDIRFPEGRVDDAGAMGGVTPGRRHSITRTEQKRFTCTAAP